MSQGVNVAPTNNRERTQSAVLAQVPATPVGGSMGYFIGTSSVIGTAAYVINISSPTNSYYTYHANILSCCF